MKKYITLLAILIGFFFSSGIYSQTTEDTKQDIMLKKLASLDGKYKGYLEYLDYGDNKSIVRLPAECEAIFNKSGNDKYLSVKFIFDEGKGRTVTGEDAWTILDEGNTFFYDSTNYAITLYIENHDYNDIVNFVFEKEGKDNNKDCIIRQAFTIYNQAFIIEKRVKYKDEESSFIRHEFHFEKIK
jgi:HKD family nuclease